MMFPDRAISVSSLLAFALMPLNLALANGPIVDLPFQQEYRDPFIRTEPAPTKDEQGQEKPGPNPKENDARTVAVDQRGRVWAGTADGVRQIADGKFAQADGQKIDGPVYDLAVGSDGVVWVGAWNGVYRIVDGRIEREEGGPAGPITAVLVTKDRIVTANDKGLDERVGGKWQPLPGPWATTILDLAIADGDLYVAAWSGLYRKSGDVVTRFAKPSEILSRNLRALAVGPDGRLWVGSRGGIDVYRAGRREKSFAGEALPSSDILSLSFDREGRLWVGTTLGTARYDGKAWSLRHSMRWLPHDEVRDAAFSDDGTAWVATKDGVSAIRRREMTLASKADYFQKQVRDRHVRPPGLVERCRLPKPGDLASFQPGDTDNDGLFTGLYVAAESYRYAVTGAADAKANAAEAYAAMEFLQTVTGTPGFVARTVIPTEWRSMADSNRTYTEQEAADQRADEARWKKVENRWRKSADGKWLWKGDTSSDEMSGHFYAYGVYYDLVADKKEKERVANLVRRIMDYIIDGGYVFRDIDGEATRWAVWSPEKLNGDPNWWLERGINSVEILSYLTVARHVTGDEKYDREIEKLLNEHGYAKNILVSMQPEPDYFTYIGFQLLALVYPGLMTYEKDADRRELYLQSMESWFSPVRHDASPLYGYVYAAFKGGDYRPEECAALLRDVPLDMIEWNVHNSKRQDVKLVEKPVEGVVQTDRLLPASERAVFRWDRDVYRADGGSEAREEATSVFWLLPYWMGRHYNLIAAP
ncbi:MAG: two-component regulator propeller domain-containing protein [Planctomycetaceae bacterium]